MATFSGFGPLRVDTDDRVSGGTRRLWELHALQPKLGLFRGREEELPYDFRDVLVLIAPRPCLVVSPSRDRYAVAQEVAGEVEWARRGWESADARPWLVQLVPDDVNRFQSAQHRVFLDWARSTLGSRGEGRR